MSNKISKTAASVYLGMAAVILVFTGLVKLLSAAGEARILAVADPLFPLTNREVLLAVGLVELSLSAYLVFGRDTLTKCLAMAWLSTSFVLYRLGVWWISPDTPCPCLGTVAELLPLDPGVLEALLKCVLAYLLIGSYVLLFWNWKQRREQVVPGLENIVGTRPL